MTNSRNHMTDTEKKVKKDKLVAKFKESFGKGLEDVFTQKGIEKFYDPNTSVDYAEGMLDKAAIALAVDELFKVAESALGVTILVNDDDDKEECCEGSSNEEYNVYNTVAEAFYEDTFKSVADAKKFIESEALKTKYTIDDFKVVRVYD